MSTMLDNIWDDPLANEPSPPRDTTAAADPADDSGDDMLRPSKRRRSSLFLDDPDEIEEQANSPSEGGTAGGAGSARPEIDAMFDEVEEMDGASSRPFDIEAYRREAQRRAEKEVVAPSSSYPQHAVRSSSPPAAGADGDKDGDDEDEPGKKGRRKIAKIDENRLLGKDGFPALVKQVKSFKPRGKGNEQADLNKLINMYQFWSHKMMPKWTFSDTVNRVEKVCRSKRMTVALSAWKDEFNGTIHGNKIGDGDDDSQSESGDEKNESNNREGAEAAPSSSPSHSRPPSSAPSSPSGNPSRPPSSASGSLFLEDDNDLFDFQGVDGGGNSSKSTSASKAPDEDVDESDMWAELDADPSAFDDPPPRPSNSRMSGIKFKPPKEVDEDDDMWGILDDMDMDQPPPPPPPPAEKSVPAPVAPVGVQHDDTVGQPNDSRETTQVSGNTTNVAPDTAEDPDWDDMYE